MPSYYFYAGMARVQFGEAAPIGGVVLGEAEETPLQVYGRIITQEAAARSLQEHAITMTAFHSLAYAAPQEAHADAAPRPDAAHGGQGGRGSGSVRATRRSGR